tara:strand:- start:1306 stop:1539 length:234 start_codon:yes stop_codon:yes gene_type:complete
MKNAIKLPKTYKDLENSPFIQSVEKCESGIFIYIEECFLKNAQFDEKTAWGKTLKEALQMLKNDFIPTIKKSYLLKK